MKCSHPDCTGVHGNRGTAEERCPSTLPRRAAQQAKYKGTAKGMLTDLRYEAKQRRT